MAGIRLVIASFGLLCLLKLTDADGHGGHHKKIIIHVPYKVKTIHHTHTVYKHVGGHGKGGGDDHEYYKVIGYSGGIDDGEVVHAGTGHGSGGGGGGGFGHGFSGGFGGGHAESHEGGYSGSHGGGHGAELSGGGHEGVSEGHGSDDFGGFSGSDHHESLVSSQSSEGTHHNFGGDSGFGGFGGGGFAGGDPAGFENYEGGSDEGSHGGYD